MAEGTANRPASSTATGVGGERGKYVDYREFVDYQLERVRSLVRSTEISTALTRMGALLAGYLLLFLVCDQWIWPGGIPLGVRWLAQASLLTALGWLGWRHVLIPAIYRVNPLYAARELERAQPGLQGNLINLVDTPAPGAASEGVLRSLERRSALTLHRTDIDEAIDRRVLLRAAYLMLGLVTVFAVYLFASPKDPFPSLQRAMLPLSRAPVATRTLISDVTPGTATVPMRRQVRVEADIRGAAVERVLLKLTTADRKLVEFPVEMERIEPGQPRFRGLIAGESGRGILGDLEYRIEAGDAVSAWYQLHVTQPPTSRVESIDYLPPEYTGLPRTTREGGAVEGLEGTRVVLHAVANEPVESARLVICDSDLPGAPGEEFPLNVSAGTRIEGDWTLRFRPDGTAPRFYRLEIRTPAGEIDPAPSAEPISILTDQKPEVTLLDPTGDLVKPLDARVPLALLASDPDFLLRTLTLKFEKNGEPLPDELLFAGRLPVRELRAEHVLDLAPLNLRPGDRLQYWIEARDNRQPVANRGATPKLTIEIAKPFDNESAIEQDLQAARENQRQLPGETADGQAPEKMTDDPPTEDIAQTTTPETAPADPSTRETTEDRPNQVGRKTTPGETEPSGESTADPAEPTPAAIDEHQQFEQQLERLLERQRQAQNSPEAETGEDAEREPRSPRSPDELNRPEDSEAGEGRRQGEPASPRQPESREPGKRSATSPQPRDRNRAAADQTNSRENNTGDQTDSSGKEKTEAESSESERAMESAKTEGGEPGEQTPEPGPRAKPSRRTPPGESPPQGAESGESQAGASNDSDERRGGQASDQPDKAAAGESPSRPQSQGSRSQSRGSPRQPGSSGEQAEMERRPGKTAVPGEQPADQSSGDAESSENKTDAGKPRTGESRGGAKTGDESEDATQGEPDGPSRPGRDPNEEAVGDHSAEPGQSDPSSHDSSKPGSKPAGAKPTDPKQGGGQRSATAGEQGANSKDPANSPDRREEGSASRTDPDSSRSASDMTGDTGQEDPAGDARQGMPGETPRDQPGKQGPGHENPRQPGAEDAPGDNKDAAGESQPENAADEGTRSEPKRPGDLPSGQRPERPGMKRPQSKPSRKGSEEETEKAGEEGTGGSTNQPGSPSDGESPESGNAGDSQGSDSGMSQSPERAERKPPRGRQPEADPAGSEEPTLDSEAGDTKGKPRSATKPGTNSPSAEEGAGGQPARSPKQTGGKNTAKSSQGQPGKPGEKNSRSPDSDAAGEGRSDDPTAEDSPQKQGNSGAGQEAGTGSSKPGGPQPGSKRGTPANSSPTQGRGQGLGQEEGPSQSAKSANEPTGGSKSGTDQQGMPGETGSSDSTGDSAKPKVGSGQAGGPSAAGREQNDEARNGASDGSDREDAAGEPGAQPREGQAARPGGASDPAAAGPGSAGPSGRDPRAGGRNQKGSTGGTGPGSGTGERSALPSDRGDGPEGPGNEPGNAGSTGESQAGGESESPSAEHLREASNLILKTLQGRLERGEVDDELLKEYGWKDLGALEKFVTRLEEQLQGSHDNSPEALARQREFDELLKSMALSGETRKRAEGQGAVRRVDQVEARRRPVPSELRQRFDAFTRGLSQTRGGATKGTLEKPTVPQSSTPKGGTKPSTRP